MIRTFRIPCRWEYSGDLYLDAETLEEAIHKAYTPQVALPEGEYLADSFQVDEEGARRYAAQEENRP